jgi:hypothetical protein
MSSNVSVISGSIQIPFIDGIHPDIFSTMAGIDSSFSTHQGLNGISPYLMVNKEALDSTIQNQMTSTIHAQLASTIHAEITSTIQNDSESTIQREITSRIKSETISTSYAQFISNSTIQGMNNSTIRANPEISRISKLAADSTVRGIQMSTFTAYASFHTPPKLVVAPVVAPFVPVVPMNLYAAPIILEVCAGMGNRLRSLVSGLCAAEELGRPLKIIWPYEPSCGVSFAQLFDLAATKLPSWVSVDASVSVAAKQQMCLTTADWDKQKTNSGIIYIKSYGQFYTSNPSRFLYWLQSLQAYPIIIEGLDAIFASAKNKVVGVHIRRGDHTKAIALSPTKDFIQVMRMYPATTFFFVASDSDAERKTLERAFPGRILTAAKNLSRDNPVGMVDSLRDFIGLARCSEILGSDGSSFSEIAALYGGCPLKVINTSYVSTLMLHSLTTPSTLNMLSQKEE